jgi:hypothetical protein
VYSKFELQLQTSLKLQEHKTVATETRGWGRRRAGVQSVQNLKCGPKTFLNSQTKLSQQYFKYQQQLPTNAMQCNSKNSTVINNKQVRKVDKVLLSSKKSTTSLLSSSSSSYTQKFQTKSK